MAAVILVNQYNQQNADGSWSQVSQWSDGSYTAVTIDPSQYAAYGIPTGTTLPDAIANASSDLQGGLPSTSHDESGLVQNPSDPASGSSSKLASILYYVDHGQIIQKDTYSDGQVVFVPMGVASSLPNGTASTTMWDLATATPPTQTSTTVPTGQSGAGNQSGPAAADGQTLWQQGALTQATFLALYGPNAGQRWVQQHNADMGAGQPQQTTQPASPVAPRAMQPGARTGATVASGLGGAGQVLTQNVRIGGLVLPAWALGAGVLGVFALGRRRRR
jgi:hypothetical protein